MDTYTLLNSMIIGSIGTAFFIYGKKQAKYIPMLTGLSFFILPYFISNGIVLWVVVIAILAANYFLREQ